MQLIVILYQYTTNQELIEQVEFGFYRTNMYN